MASNSDVEKERNIKKDRDKKERNLEKDIDNMKEPLISKHDDEDQDLFMVLLCTAVAVSGSFVFGTCMGYSSPVQVAVMKELNMSYSQYSIFGSILNIGAMLGAVISGQIADSIGRKGAMRVTSIICSAGWLLIYFSSEPILLYIGRFFTGCSIGIISYVVPVFIGEITPDKLRGGLSSLNQLFVVLGISAAFVMGSFIGWRTLALTGNIYCLIFFVGLFYIPESPRWLAMSRSETEFKTALQRLRGPNADISEEINHINEYLKTHHTLEEASFWNLFDDSNRKATIIAVGLMVFQQFSGVNGVVFYSDNVFMQAGFDPSTGSILYSIVQILVTGLGASLIDKAGRRPLLLMGSFGMCLCCSLIASSFLLKAENMAPVLSPYLDVIGVLGYIAAFSIGMGAGPWLVMSEVFPLHMKGLGGGLAVLVNWSSSFVVSYTFNFLVLWSPHGTFFYYSFICGLAMIFIAKELPETKGRSLEEIHASLNSKVK